MSGSNALQITDPNADNPLAQAPSWAADSTTGAVNSATDPLTQWLAAQRAKNQQQKSSLAWNADTGYMGPGTARVEPEKMYDVRPLLDLGRIEESSSSPIFSDKYWRQQMLWQQMDSARMLASTDPTPQRQQAYQLASQAYLTSLDDPNLPEAQLQTRLDAASAQSPRDANVMMQAIQRRQQQGR